MRLGHIGLLSHYIKDAFSVPFTSFSTSHLFSKPTSRLLVPLVAKLEDVLRQNAFFVKNYVLQYLHYKA